MSIVALNCGSFFRQNCRARRLTASAHLGRARVEQIGTPSAVLRVGADTRAIDAADIDAVIDALLGEIERHVGERKIAGFVHRVVHGGEEFTRPTRIDAARLAELDSLSALAPLHNPPAIAAIRSACKMFADVPHYAVFDTSFHATLPPHAKEYALPKSVRERYGIRRFGFHGISHEHVMQRTAARLQRLPRDLRIVSCHLGNGASVTAIEHGKSVQTSMGMTPLEGTRSWGRRAGDLDPGVLLELMRDYGPRRARATADTRVRARRYGWHE